MTHSLTKTNVHGITLISEKLSADYWKARYVALLEKDTWSDLHKFATVRNNPYYAVVNATAFCLNYGYFRGYEHFASVFFADGSKYYLGLKVHKERTRTHIDNGAYVTDWYVSFEEEQQITRHEQLYRATVGMLVSCELRNTANFVKYTQHHDHNIRIKEDADQKAQITSQ